MIRSRKKSIFKVLGLLLLCCLMVVGSSLTAYAASPRDDLIQEVSKTTEIDASSKGGKKTPSLTDKTYKKTGGGEYTYDVLFNKSGEGDKAVATGINEVKFGELTSKAQTEFVSDVAERCVAAELVNDNITEETVEDWWRELQSVDGMGSKFLSVVLENTKPDFVSANRIYKPFSGIVGTVLGLIAILIMGFLGIVIVADISYITIPPIRMAVADGNDAKGGKLPISKVFSHDAIYAVQVSETESEGGGSPKQALGVYLGRRIPMLILLGICLLYLVSGNIYTLVGYILDLVSGFLGF